MGAKRESEEKGPCEQGPFSVPEPGEEKGKEREDGVGKCDLEGRACKELMSLIDSV